MIDAWLEPPCEDDSNMYWENLYEEYKEKHCTCDINEDCQCMSFNKFIDESKETYLTWLYG